MSKLFGGVFITAIIFRKAFQDNASPGMLVFLAILCTFVMVIVILQAIFGKS